MIAYDFDYYRPATFTEAVQLFHSLDKDGKDPKYFSGGTEIITLGRLNKVITGAVIDIQGIPECNVFERQGEHYILGAAFTLNKVREAQCFPLLSKCIAEIADNTARNKITLGGNICSDIIYKETVLPFLLTDSDVVIATAKGLERRPLREVFHQNLQLERGEFLVQVITPLSDLELPYRCVKKRRHWDVGYPLITVAAIKKEGQIRLAFSGLCDFPFRDSKLEACFNDSRLSIEEQIAQALACIPSPILDDVHGSAEYRRFVLANTLKNVRHALEGANENDN